MKIETNRKKENGQQITESMQPTDDRTGQAGLSQSQTNNKILRAGMGFQGLGSSAYQETGPCRSRSPHRIFNLSEMKNKTGTPRAAGFNETYDMAQERREARSPAPEEPLSRYQNLQSGGLLSSWSTYHPSADRNQTNSSIEPNRKLLQCRCNGDCPGHGP
jgi:hypothetical protein